MSSFLLHPVLFIGGLIAVASPIIIHLLNKRRFKKVDWAAMDFLLQAQRLNRRKVKLEEFILLLLRCIAMVLLGLLLARPFISSDKSGSLFQTARYERVIVLDDSLSMNADAGGGTPMLTATKMLDEWITGLASNDSDDSLTFVLASRPEKPLFNGVPLTETSYGELLREIKDLRASDAPTRLSVALGEVDKLISEEREDNLSRIVYVLSDMRVRDWSGGGSTAADEGDESRKDAVETLKQIASKAAGCYVMDLGAEGDANLVVEEIVPRDKALIAGVASDFDVIVRNLGRETANDVKVRFAASEAIPQESTIDRIESGQRGAASFSYAFAPAEDGEPEPVVLQAEVVADDGSVRDLLADDNQRYYPARVSKGIDVLIVDGDPSGNFGSSESYFLKKALAPRGRANSGIVVTTADDSEFDDMRLADFQVVILANLYRITEQRRAALEEWVSAGGGLVIALGDQVDEDLYNEELYADGKGIMPGKIGMIRGDETEETWSYFHPVKTNHSVMRIFEGDSNPLIEAVKIFRWWQVEASEAAVTDGSAVIVAEFTDPDKSPALVEGRFGEGRVLMMTSPLDADWSSWPEEGASYVIAMQETVRYLARSRVREGLLAVSDPIEQSINLADYRSDAAVEAPITGRVGVQAQPPPEGNSTEWSIRFEETGNRGFYRLLLKPTTGGEDRTVLFAANIDPAEGNLERMNTTALRSELEQSGIELVSGSQPVVNFGAVAGKSEFWKLALYALAGILCLELVYGWWIGARR